MNNILPKISIIIPVYNVEKYLRQCLDSVVNQTLKDLQIICVDDGSTDGSLAILREYADRDKRFEVYSKSNEGAGIARNFAYPYIKGKYTFFMDPDDWLELDGFEQIYILAEKNATDVVCINCYINGEVQPMQIPNQTCWVSPDTNKRLCLLQISLVYSWGKLYKTDFLIKNNVYFSKALRSQDNIVHWKSCLLGNVFCFYTLPIYHYRIVNIPSENTIRYNKRCLSILFAMQEIDEFLQRNSYNDYLPYLSIYKFLNIWGYYIKADRYTQIEFKKNISVLTEKDWEELLRLPYPISLKMFFFFISLKYKFPFFLWGYGFIKRMYERITGKFPPVQTNPSKTEK